jgi:hypothetical protein
VIEEAFGAIVGECSMRFRVFGVAMLHSTALAEAATTAQCIIMGPRRLLFCSRRFAVMAGPVVQRLGPQLATFDGSHTEKPVVTTTYADLPLAWFPSRDRASASVLGRGCTTGPLKSAPNAAQHKLAAALRVGAEAVRYEALPSVKWRLRATGLTRVYPLVFELPPSVL